MVQLALALLLCPHGLQLLGGHGLYFIVVSEHKEGAEAQQNGQNDAGDGTGQEAGQHRGGA